MPHFNVDDQFSDSKEVLAIPARYRNAAVGLWTRCGSWSANKLTDGYVPDEVVRGFAGRKAASALTEVLVSANLWTLVDSGGIQFENWAKWQRTKNEVKTFRARRAERMRVRRDTAGTPPGHPRDTAKTNRIGHEQRKHENVTGNSFGTSIPKPKDTNVTTHLGSETYVSSSAVEPLSAAVNASAWRLVKAHVSDQHPQANRTELAMQANELLMAGTPTELIEAALSMWNHKPGRGPKVLRHLVSDVIRERDTCQLPAVNGRPLSGLESKIAGYQELKKHYREQQ